MNGVYQGGRLYVDSLFSFNSQLGQDYSGAWSDDSTFLVTVIDSSWRSGPLFEADGTVDEGQNNCTAGIRAGLTVRNLASTSLPVNGSSPPMSGNAGVDKPPVLVSIFGSDPDFGDATMSFGDSLVLTLDLQTDRAGAVVGVLQEKSYVDSVFNFSATLGAAYEGAWADDSTFQISLLDGTGSELHTELGAIMANPLPLLKNLGCRPDATTRGGQLLSYRSTTSNRGMCNTASGRVGPLVARDDGGEGSTGNFTAQFGVRPRIYGVVVDE
eukprot:2699388-Prymnesium_polylepis.1